MNNRLRNALSLVLLIGSQLFLYQLFLTKPHLLGPDYRFDLPRLLEGLLFIQSQGWVPPYYSSFLCGGFPLYADPQSMFYSIPQLLLAVTSPWKTIIFTTILFSSVGAIGTYLLLGLVKAKDDYRILAAVSFALNGFFISRMFIGHFGFHSFQLTPLILYLIFSPASNIYAAIGSGFLLSYSVYSGGHYAIFIILTSVLFSGLIILVTDPSWSFRAIAQRFLLALCVTALVSASKIVAALGLMTTHARHASFSRIDTLFHAVRLVATQLVSQGSYRPFDFGLWEYNTSIAIGIVVFALFGLLVQAKKPAAILILIGFIVIADLATGYSFLGVTLQKLPILSQLRANIRLTSALLVPLILLGAIGYTSLWSSAQRWAWMGCFVTVLIHCSQLAPQVNDSRCCSIEKADEVHAEILRGEPFVVQKIGVKRKNDLDSMFLRESNPTCYVTMYSRPPNRTLRENVSIYEVDNERFNMIFPPCYWWRSEYQCQKGQLIHQNDRENLDLLLTHRNPNWKLPWVQKAANLLSLGGVLCAVALLFFRSSNMSNKTVAALTGSIGSGKSEAAKVFQQLGAIIVDADVLARQAVEPGTKAYQAIVDAFGQEILNADNSINRKKLGALVFGYPEKLLTLENIVHPEVRRLFQVELEKFKSSPSKVFIYVVPLLFEKLQDLSPFEKIITVAAPDEICLKRVMERDGIPHEEATKRLLTQLPTTEKIARSDFVIQNDGSIESLNDQIRKIFSILIRS